MNAQIKLRNVLLLFCGLALISSCRKENGFREFATKDVSVEGFDSIVVNGLFEIHLVQDTFFSVRFEGEQRVMNRTSAEVRDSVLYLESSRKGDAFHPSQKTMAVYIHLNNLHRITTNEDCTIDCENELTGNEIGLVAATRWVKADLKLNCNTFYYWNNPNGITLDLTGNVDVLKLWNVGLAGVDASTLNARYVIVENGSQSDCKVRASETVEYKLTNTGNIIYYGHPPQLTEDGHSGSGQLIAGD